MAGQELSQTHGETLPRIKGNMTFEKNVRVCLCCGGGRGGPRGWVRVPLSTLPFSPPFPTSLFCLLSLRWRLIAVSGCSSLSHPICLSFISEMKLEGKCNLRRPTQGGKYRTRPPPDSASEHSSLPAGLASSPRPSSVAALGSEPGQLHTSLGSPGAGGSPGRARGRTRGKGGEPPQPLRSSGLPGQPSPLLLPSRACFSLE